MPIPETMRTNMIVAQMRLRPPRRRRVAGGWSSNVRGADTRGAATDGPVGDVRKGFPSSRRSSTDKSGLAKIFQVAEATPRGCLYSFVAGDVAGTPDGVARNVNARRRCAWPQQAWRRVLPCRFVPAPNPIRRQALPR